MHDRYYGPRFLVRVASLEMHPLDTLDRIETLADDGGLGLCNITKCCTEVCPEEIHITDNAIIPLKERLVDRRYDPIAKLWRRFRSPRRPSRPAPHGGVADSGTIGQYGRAYESGRVYYVCGTDVSGGGSRSPAPSVSGASGVGSSVCGACLCSGSSS